jgi:ferredoxin
VIPHPAFATVASDSARCLLCGACANQCKVKALRMLSTESDIRLFHDPLACLNCGVCVAICPESALSLEGGMRLDRSFLAQRELSRVKGLQCATCGRIFTTVKRAERVSQRLLAVRGEDNIRAELLKLCPECRGKKAFFTYAGWTAGR